MCGSRKRAAAAPGSSAAQLKYLDEPHPQGAARCARHLYSQTAGGARRLEQGRLRRQDRGRRAEEPRHRQRRAEQGGDDRCTGDRGERRRGADRDHQQPPGHHRAHRGHRQQPVPAHRPLRLQGERPALRQGQREDGRDLGGARDCRSRRQALCGDPGSQGHHRRLRRLGDHRYGRTHENARDTRSRLHRGARADDAPDGDRAAQGLRRQAGADAFHPESHRQAERQDRGRRADQPGGIAQPGVLLPSQGRRQGRQDRSRLARQPGRLEQQRIRGRVKPIALLAALALTGAAQAQDTAKEIQRYRQMIAEGSPVELFEFAGEELWKRPQGPSNVSLEKCDLGRGPGVLKGAYARLPRYFKDADRVMDLETRLLHCMTTVQGRSREEATKRVFGTEDAPSEMEYLSAYIAAASRGAPMAPGAAHPKEREAYALGQKLFFYRAGPWDFSCASCHGEQGKRIRMQELPVLSTPAAARPVDATWPAYRVSNSQFKTMQWRINDCYRQMRMPEPNYTSDLTIAIATYLTVTGRGEPYLGPGTKR